MSRQEVFCAAAAIFPVLVLLVVVVIEDVTLARRYGRRLSRIEQDLYGTNQIRDVEPKE